MFTVRLLHFSPTWLNEIQSHYQQSLYICIYHRTSSAPLTIPQIKPFLNNNTATSNEAPPSHSPPPPPPIYQSCAMDATPTSSSSSSSIIPLSQFHRPSLPLPIQLTTTTEDPCTPPPHTPSTVCNTPPSSREPTPTPSPCSSPLTTSATIPDEPWIHSLLRTKFYGPCHQHSNLRRNEQNIFCKTHGNKICHYCHLNSNNKLHSNCVVLHVTRYMYHDVLLSNELSSELDIVNIQPYVNNGHRVIYIDRRSQPLSNAAPNAKTCLRCDRTLQDPYKFCCVFCKLSSLDHPAANSNLPLPDAGRLYNQQQQLNNNTNSNIGKKRNNMTIINNHHNSNKNVPNGLKKKRKGIPVRSLLSTYNGSVVTE